MARLRVKILSARTFAIAGGCSMLLGLVTQFETLFFCGTIIAFLGLFRLAPQSGAPSMTALEHDRPIYEDVWRGRVLGYGPFSGLYDWERDD